eukprot:617032-Amorphochlora_amoeboformis.AAC.1
MVRSWNPSTRAATTPPMPPITYLTRIRKQTPTQPKTSSRDNSRNYKQFQYLQAILASLISRNPATKFHTPPGAYRPFGRVALVSCSCRARSLSKYLSSLFQERRFAYDTYPKAFPRRTLSPALSLSPRFRARGGPGREEVWSAHDVQCSERFVDCY